MAIQNNIQQTTIPPATSLRLPQEANIKETGAFKNNNPLIKMPKKVAKQIANNLSKTQISSSNEIKIEGVQVEGYETLTSQQKQNLAQELKTYKERIKSSVKDGSFDKFIKTAFSRQIDNPQELKALKEAVKNGEWDKVIPKIKIGDQTTFNTAKDSEGNKVDALGAFIKGSSENGSTGTIILNKTLFDGPIEKNGQTINLQNILTEEVAHAWDSRINNTDSKGDEGEAFALLLKTGNLTEKDVLSELNNKIKAALAENDSGTMLIDGKEVEVEFGFFKSFTKAISKGFKDITHAVTDTVTNVITAPLKLASAVLPDDLGGDFFDSAVNTIEDVTDKLQEETDRIVDQVAEEAIRVADRAWEVVEKEILQSKWLGAVLTVASFIPGLGTVAMVGRLALATYQVRQGILTGNMQMALGGIVSGVAGAQAGGLITSAAAQTAATGVQTAYAAHNAIQAAEDGNYTAAAFSAAAVAGGTGIIGADTVKTIQQGAMTVDAIKNRDTTAIGRIATGYIGENTDWGKNNRDTLNTVNTSLTAYNIITSDANDIDKARAVNALAGQTNWGQDYRETLDTIDSSLTAYDVITSDAGDTTKARAITALIGQSEIISQDMVDALQSANDLYEASENKDWPKVLTTIANSNYVNSDTAESLNLLAKLQTAKEKDDTNQIVSLVANSGYFNSETAQNINTLNSVANNVKSGNIEGLIQEAEQSGYINTQVADYSRTANELYTNYQDSGLNGIIDYILSSAKENKPENAYA